jgi:hypothetical protein
MVSSSNHKFAKQGSAYTAHEEDMEPLDRISMKQMARGGGVRGRKGVAVRADPDSIGWIGQDRATPSAPAGGGGPGYFKPQGPQLDDSPSALEQPLIPGPMQAPPPQPPPNPPPATNPRSLGSQKSVQSTHLDVAITARIIADGTKRGIRGAQTSFSALPPFTSPGFQSDASGNITGFTGRNKKFTWKGTITIQTVYGPHANARDVSCYGRGTTTADIQNRDITLGFHEHCHQNDYENFLSAHPLPDPPRMEIGMPSTEYEQELARFQQEFDAYQPAMDVDSQTRTDEVGHTQTTADQTGNCYRHQVP